MKAWIGAVALAGLMASDGAMAFTGNELIEACNAYVGSPQVDPRKQFAAGQCSGLVSGVANMLIVLHDRNPTGFPVCMPESGFTNGQAARVYLKYLNNHPEDLDIDASTLAIVAFRQAYPCKK